MFIETVHAASIIPDFNEAQDFGYFIKNIYNISIGLVGLAVFVQFLRAGVEYMLAAGNIGKIENAKQYMTNAILGAVLLLSAYLILNVINPDLLNINLFNKEYLVKQIQQDAKPAVFCNPTFSNDPNCQKTGSDEAKDKQNQLEQNGILTSDITNVTSIDPRTIDYLTSLTKNGGNARLFEGHSVGPSYTTSAHLPEGNFIVMSTDEALKTKIQSFGQDAVLVMIDEGKRPTYTDEASGVVYIGNSNGTWNVYFPERESQNP